MDTWGNWEKVNSMYFFEIYQGLFLRGPYNIINVDLKIGIFKKTD